MIINLCNLLLEKNKAAISLKFDKTESFLSQKTVHLPKMVVFNFFLRP